MRPHADFETLVAYWLGELGPDHQPTLEEHYLGCEECSTRLAEVETLAAGVRRAFDGGLVAAALTPQFVERLRSAGVRLREYRVPRNGSVNCSIGPQDQMLVARLEAPTEGVERIDVIADGVRIEDVAFDPAHGEVVVTPGTERVRAMPAHRQVMRLVAVAPGGERVLGEYTFNHSPNG